MLDYFLRFWIYIFDRLILYPLLKHFSRKVGTHFLNLGYWPTTTFNDNRIIKTVESILEGEKDPKLPHYYLYEKALSLHHAYPLFSGHSIFEVGCGQGEGIEWIKRAHPGIKKIEGLDPIPQNHPLIYKGSADKIPIADSSMDLVLNIESSHLYKNCQNFFSESMRILKSGGYICWADLRYKEQIEAVKEQAVRAGLIEQKWLDITPNVLQGIPRTTVYYDNVIDQAPLLIKLFKSSLRTTYCAPGTKTHAKFVNGTKGYYCALWQKPI
ncbi:unnamed protein product [Auanema sp. JU1783]|nr:unnamed protein product [Auanema sp. JU1783]